MTKIFDSLSNWFAKGPVFPSGITVGNGTPPSYSSTTGAQTAAAPVALGVDTSGNVTLGTGSGGLATLNSNPLLAVLSGTTQQSVQVGNFSATILASTSSISGTFTLPHTFATSLDAVFLNARINTHLISAVASAYTTSSFGYVVYETANLNVGSNTTITVDYLAIGH